MISIKKLYLLPFLIFSPLIGADEVSEKGAVKGRHIVFLFKKILGKLQDDYWSSCTVGGFQARSEKEWERSFDQSERSIQKFVGVGQNSRANMVLMNDNKEVENK